MKKGILFLLTAVLLLGTLLMGCSPKDSSELTPGQGEDTNPSAQITELKVGATPVPHAELLELVKEDLKAQGIELKIIEFTDYVTPNLVLADKEIDANFFQHAPYMEGFAASNNIDIVSLGNVHVEPLGLYSKTIKSVDELKEGSIVAIPNDPTNGGRALILLEEQGLITLAKNSEGKVDLEVTEKDIVENPKGLVFKALEAAQLPRVLADVDAAVINGNYALEAELVPTTDAIFLEGPNSPYPNVIAIRKGEENNENLKALLKALQSDKVKKFIEEKYNGGVVPAF